MVLKDRFKQMISWTLVFFWMGLIFYLSGQVAAESDNLSLGLTQTIINIMDRILPGLDVGAVLSNHLVRKSAHFFAYLVLGILVMNATSVSYNGFTALGICGIYAISDEVHQLFVPGRSGQLKDVLIDSAGALVGIGIYLLLVWIRKRRV